MYNFEFESIHVTTNYRSNNESTSINVYRYSILFISIDKQIGEYRKYIFFTKTSIPNGKCHSN